jgi:tetratricopeptide (TPR) repeat protein
LDLKSAGQDAAAEAYLQRAIAARRSEGKLAGRDAALLAGLGELLLKAGQTTPAAAALAEAVDLATWGFSWSLMLARAYRLDGKFNLAEKAWLQAQQFCSKVDQQAALAMERGEQLSAAGKWSEAGEAFAGAAIFAGQRAEASFKAAEAYCQAGDAQAAREWLSEAVDANPGDPRVAELRSRIEKMPAPSTNPASRPG